MDPVRPRRLLREAALVAAGLASVYLLTLTANHAEAEDALSYAAGIRAGAAGEVLHPHHVLWGALGWLGHNAALALGRDSGPLGVLQVLNALTGAAGIGLLWWWLRGLGWRPVACVLACGLLGFSYGYWFYSGEAEVYVLSAVALILSLVAAHAAALRPSTRTFALLGAANGLAVLAHDTNVLFAGVALSALLIGRGTAPRAVLARRFTAYVLVAAAVVAPAYAAAALVNDRETPAQAYDWITSYASSGKWGRVQASSPPKAASGAGRALVGAHYAFGLEATEDALERAGGRNPREELFMMRDYPDGVAVALLGLTALLVVAVAAAAVRVWRARSGLGPLGTLCAAWAATYLVFFTWWEPLNIEFWIALWVPLAILLALPLAGRPAPRERLHVALLVGGLALVNLAGSMIPASDDGDDYWRLRTQWYADNATPDDLVVTNNYVQSNYVSYFSGAVVVDGEYESGFKARAAVADWTERVLASNEAFDPAADEFSSCKGGEQCERARILRDGLLPGARVIAEPRLEKVWLITRRERNP